MTNKLKCFILSFTLIFSFVFLPGCTTIMSEQIREQALPDLNLSKVMEKPDSFKGKTVIWGGEIVETVNQKDGTALVTVYQRPLTSYYAPDIYSDSEGRFLLKADKYLDPYAYRKGRKITVGGVILGGENRREGEIEYWYTVITAKEIYLWNESYYSSPDPVNYYNDPFRNCCPYYYHPQPRHNRTNRLDRIPLPFD